MTTLPSALRRALVGRPVVSTAASTPRMGRWQALPVTSSNALSSLAYAPDEIILTLVAAGTAALALGPLVGWLVVGVMLLILASFRAAVVAVPRGGIYRMARTKLGPRSGVVASAALLLDFVFTAAVSAAAFAHYAGSLVPALSGHQVAVASAGLVLVLIASLRGSRVTRRLLPAVVGVFVALVAGMVVVGLAQDTAGVLGDAVSAGRTVEGSGLGSVRRTSARVRDAEKIQ